MNQLELVRKECNALCDHVVQIGSYVSMTIGLEEGIIQRKGFVSTKPGEELIDIHSSLGKAILGKQKGTPFTCEIVGVRLYGIIDEVYNSKINIEERQKVLK